MKLEKMNDQQIRCTLTKEDLAARSINLNELAYGSDSARSLFREMMTRAEAEFDFNAGDIPLMIEAVPMGHGCLVLTITKVDDPEELDTRFAQFAPSLMDEDEQDSDGGSSADLSDDLSPEANKELSDLFEKIASLPRPGSEEKEDIPLPESLNLVRLFSFDSMDTVIRLSGIIAADIGYESSLYKDPSGKRYLMFIEQSHMDLVSFNRICNIISEYGESEKNLQATQAYLEEHFECVIASCAIEKLAQI